MNPFLTNLRKEAKVMLPELGEVAQTKLCIDELYERLLRALREPDEEDEVGKVYASINCLLASVVLDREFEVLEYFGYKIRFAAAAAGVHDERALQTSLDTLADFVGEICQQDEALSERRAVAWAIRTIGWLKSRPLLVALMTSLTEAEKLGKEALSAKDLQPLLHEKLKQESVFRDIEVSLDTILNWVHEASWKGLVELSMPRTWHAYDVTYRLTEKGWMVWRFLNADERIIEDIASEDPFSRK